MAEPTVQEHLNDPITKHMRTDFARLNVNLCVGEALAAVREKPPEGRIIYFYVVDEENRLCGVVPTRRLLLASPDRPVGEIMVRGVVSISEAATVLDACECFIQHKLLAFPVVDAQKRLVGIIDVELYTQERHDLDRREQSDELFQLIGVHLNDQQQTAPLTAFRSRFPWLLTNIGGGIAAAFLSGIFEAELQKVVALALFIPVVLALAESVAIQSVSLALQVLRGKRTTVGDLLRKLRSEISIGLFLGTACGLIVAGVAFVWLGQARVALCLIGGIVGGVSCAAVVGVAIPTVLRIMRRDPQVAAGPIALASADMITLTIYFTLARALFG